MISILPVDLSECLSFALLYLAFSIIVNPASSSMLSSSSQRISSSTPALDNFGNKDVNLYFSSIFCNWILISWSVEPLEPASGQNVVPIRHKRIHDKSMRWNLESNLVFEFFLAVFITNLLLEQYQELSKILHLRSYGLFDVFLGIGPKHFCCLLLHSFGFSKLLARFQPSKWAKITDLSIWIEQTFYSFCQKISSFTFS